MPTVTIHFAGICTHFQGVAGLPRVPHRVVLPPTANFSFGIVRGVPETTGPVPFYLQPHFAILKDVTNDPTGMPLEDVPGILKDGSFEAAAILEVIPRMEGVPSYDADYLTQVPALTHFVPGYVPSQEVITGGRAVCYFDVYGGTQIAADPGTNGAMGVRITYISDQPLQLLFRPMSSLITIPPPVDLADGQQLLMMNSELSPTMIMEDTPFDFLLHYITAQSGIPEGASPDTPGFKSYDPSKPLTRDTVGEALESLRCVITSGSPADLRPSRELLLQARGDILNPSCSDAHYP